MSTNLNTLRQRIRDRLTPEWLTPSQQKVWSRLQQFEGAPHRIINVYGRHGTGKTFLGWLMEREGYASYSLWSQEAHPTHPRLVLDNAYTDRERTRALRPQIDTLGVQQIILFSRQRVEEQAMPAFELRVTADDLAYFRANLWRNLNIVISDDDTLSNYAAALDAYVRS